MQGVPIRSHFAVSLRHAKDSLSGAGVEGTTTIKLRPDESGKPVTALVEMDVRDEIQVPNLILPPSKEGRWKSL